jgi:two-component system chemotaxis response regulator CheY
VLVRALVVDDSRAMRLILARVLRERGCEVVEAGDGQEALVALSAGELPDVALVDWNMPVLNGLELVEAVRRDPAYQGMRIVMVTTESESSQVVRALEAGADEYLFKPFTPDAVVDKLAMLGLLLGV